VIQKKLLTEIKPNISKAVFFAKRQLAELVCDAVNLEGIAYTLPEVQTLLDGVTVGGHKSSDQMITLNQAQAWKWLFQSVLSGNFEISKDFVLQLHAISAKEEALEWGCFRNGRVMISGTEYLPPEPAKLDNLWFEVVHSISAVDNIVNRAIYLFLYMARYQFFYDVNKRTARFMMNGILLSNGYPVINVPAKRAAEFNSLMLEYYDSGDFSDMLDFMISCYDPILLEIMAE